MWQTACHWRERNACLQGTSSLSGACPSTGITALSLVLWVSVCPSFSSWPVWCLASWQTHSSKQQHCCTYALIRSCLWLFILAAQYLFCTCSSMSEPLDDIWMKVIESQPPRAHPSSWHWNNVRFLLLWLSVGEITLKGGKAHFGFIYGAFGPTVVWYMINVECSRGGIVWEAKCEGKGLEFNAPIAGYIPSDLISFQQALPPEDSSISKYELMLASKPPFYMWALRTSRNWGSWFRIACRALHHLWVSFTQNGKTVLVIDGSGAMDIRLGQASCSQWWSGDLPADGLGTFRTVCPGISQSHRNLSSMCLNPFSSTQKMCFSHFLLFLLLSRWKCHTGFAFHSLPFP